MANPNRYNSLGQILAAGGEISLGLMLARGATESDVLTMIALRYPGLPQSDVQALYDIAEAGATAGVRINYLSLDEYLDIAELPTQPSLFGTDTQGRRYRLVADVTDNLTGRTIQVALDPFQQENIEQLTQAFGGLIQRWLDESPALKERFAEVLVQHDISVNFLFAEKRF